MDADRFDTLARSLTAARSRRGALVAAFAGSLGLLSVVHPDDVTAKKACPQCTKRKKGKCKPKPDGAACPGGSCQRGRCATCSDGVKNGTETDVDCGGSCPRCGSGRACTGRNDCRSAYCPDGTCAACTADTDCPSDAAGGCRCRQPDQPGAPKSCTQNIPTADFVINCDLCGDKICIFDGALGANRCYKRCGAA